ncbi:MAG: IS1182 family transposase [Firmicutes bacterium]|nr:IS1182 family transposase [Bacillota bacterium]
MLKTQCQQGNFYDTDYVCEELIPQDSFFRKFKEIVSPLINDEEFETMYCLDNGRPAISPSLLAIATILQFYRNLSDREMERACMYDIEIKYALGLRLDEKPFEHSSLGDFRKRLLENSKEKEIFDCILNKLVEAGLIEKSEMQRIDATHIIADIAIPSMITLVKKGIFEILKPLKCRYEAVYKKMGNEINLEEYSKEKINQETAGRFDIEKRKKKLVEVVKDARTVLRHIKNIKVDRAVRRKIEMLKRILQENIEEDEDGNPRGRDFKKKLKDILVSPIDSDARYGAKSDKKRFTGYKANVTETVESRFITNIKAMPGNSPDGKTAVEAVTEQRKNGLIPLKVIGDTAYGDGKYRKELKENGTEVVAPLKVVNDRTKAIYPKSMFQYNEHKQTLMCPKGITTKESYYDRRTELKVFHFPMSRCNRCSGQKECTTDKEGRRTVGISPVNKELREAEKYNLTEQFKEEMKLRPPIEGKLSELVMYHGLRRTRYRGLGKVSLQCYFTAAAVNIKRWIKILIDKMKPPKLAEAMAV